MTRRQRSQPPDPALAPEVRRELTMIITSDDMGAQLKRLAREGRRDDCIALMQELGDWQSRAKKGSKEPILWIPSLPSD
ncbi:MAG: hypothetical protein EBZ29_04305 [Synechococcaceae bacterium WB9_4xC_028]|jgi:hypothetical protein|uniref:hypothetical protein n=1 Tax=Synechococcus sp. HK01-R TaxID=2751171 RepID=UPI0016262693|nr:hypothetical protein [Synechococcus sp. HK01-R]NDD68624.1 hypothetical protein [Synechococcaceae bacterium WB9_4xC_028]QNG26946.1 hypothetical protein H0O21_12300 [Synechococcus sp. HK01-R]